MKILNSPTRIQSSLRSLLDQSKQVYFAVAWATHHHEFYKELVKQKDKIAMGFVGLSFFQTSAEFIESFLNYKNVHFIKPSNGGVFHPKVYIFELENQYAVIIGSANMTNGALTVNKELCMQWYADKDDAAVISLLKSVQAYSKLKQAEVSAEWLELYREKARAYKRAVKKINIAKKTAEVQNILPDLEINIDWAAYSAKIMNGMDQNGLDMRLRLMNRCQELLSKQSLAQMDYADRKIIAGVDDKASLFVNGWFGSINGTGVGKHINQHHPHVFSEGLDHIPFKGEITKKHYDLYIEAYEEHIKNNNFSRTPSIITLSRFLAVKRPDFFVSLNNKNYKQLAATMEFKKKNTKENYWELMQLIHQLPWYKAKVSKTDDDYLIWKYRVAMLDAIFFKE